METKSRPHREFLIGCLTTHLPSLKGIFGIMLFSCCETLKGTSPPPIYSSLVANGHVFSVMSKTFANGCCNQEWQQMPNIIKKPKAFNKRFISVGSVDVVI